MQVNTNLEKQDYLKAYKDMFSFLFRQPLLAAGFFFLCLLTESIPFAWFPLKLASYAILISLIVCVTSLHFRSGSLRGLAQELRFQQAVYLPAVVLILCLSWLGFVVADFLISMVSVSAQQTNPHVAAMAAGSAQAAGELFVAVVATALICLAQIMPFVLAHFCHGLGFSRAQGEKIWVSLMLQPKTLMAFIPIAHIVPLGLMMQWNLTGLIVAFGALYSTFLLFIVFNIEPASRSEVKDIDLASGHAAG
ncbi:hypothetical protein [Alteromonas antoniana]|uniref:hypothetical protein n=1 Tax=Alteromonas antoniana TaxID=2803813 RepID=UPI001C457837|nr:hypothetical protein [Alteromonas antoniana]